MHSRDWNVGEGIPSQIFRSVADSRKTIIVLSQVNTLLLSMKKIVTTVIVIMMIKIVKMMMMLVEYLTNMNVQSYVESKWSDMEFMAAHKKALQDKIQVCEKRKVIE